MSGHKCYEQGHDMPAPDYFYNIVTRDFYVTRRPKYCVGIEIGFETKVILIDTQCPLN